MFVKKLSLNKQKTDKSIKIFEFITIFCNPGPLCYAMFVIDELFPDNYFQMICSVLPITINTDYHKTRSIFGCIK